MYVGFFGYMVEHPICCGLVCLFVCVCVCGCVLFVVCYGVVCDGVRLFVVWYVAFGVWSVVCCVRVRGLWSGVGMRCVC